MAESAIGVERPATAGEIALARLDIEYLRRKYAKATDLLQSRLGWGVARRRCVKTPSLPRKL